MAKHWSYLLFTLWFCYLIVSTILLFTRGFLLTRVTQEKNSTCLTLPEIPCSIQEDSLVDSCSASDKLSMVVNAAKSASNFCLPSRAKVILMVIDALRYDFTLYDESNAQPMPYENKLPVIAKLIRENPNSARLFKFVADPPTTTMQRLKGLTTGSLPTFIDAGSNFASQEITEDNLIDQLIRLNKTAIFLGDDTWMDLYPGRFKRAYPFPSLVVKDLDTVDGGILKNIYNEIQKQDWHLLVAHFLGVDHCGHTFGPNHPEMIRKLSEMNTAIENIAQQMDDNTILYVIGDHGMTSTGDHGGDTESEISTALFVYSKRQLLSYDDKPKEVKQINIVPTLAHVLGIPIPFSNLGTLIFEAIPAKNSSYIPEWKLSLFALWANVEQTVTYIREYSSATDTFKPETLQTFYEKYALLNGKLFSVDSEESFLKFSQACKQLISDLRNLCEEVWIQFDTFSMMRGLLLNFLSLFFVFIITDGIPADRLPEIFRSSFLLCSYVALLGAALLSVVLYHFELVDNLQASIFFLGGFISQFMLAMLIIQNWEIISMNWYERSKRNKAIRHISRIVVAFSVCGLFSNSYILEEAFVLLFLLVTVTLTGTVKVIKGVFREKGAKLTKYKFVFLAIGVAVLLRFTTYFWRCRSDHPACQYDLSVKQSTKVEWSTTLVCLGLFITATRVWLRNCGNLNGFTPTVFLARYAPTVIVVSTGVYWALQKLPTTLKKSSLPFETNVFAWLIYFLSTVGVLAVFTKPLCVYILPKKREITVPVEANPIPHIFRQIKGLFSEKRENADEVPVICGLATVYSAGFLVVGVYITLISGLLLGDVLAPSAVIMFMTVMFILIVTSILRIESASSVDDLFEVPNLSILVWVILSHYFFYASGHQPTFSNINWDAAFVGTTGVFLHNAIPATLVIISTFCSYILMGFFLPLILIIPFTLFVMVPSVVGKNKNLQKDFARGELLLFEKDNKMLVTVFTMSCKYVTCHALRVFASMLAATIHCRHLMVWGIFAPKFIFEAIGMFVTLASVVCGYLLLVRINNKVESLIVWVNKNFS